MITGVLECNRIKTHDNSQLRKEWARTWLDSWNFWILVHWRNWIEELKVGKTRELIPGAETCVALSPSAQLCV